MKIEIEQNCSGTGDYRWYLYTGPEHIDEYTGYCFSLGECFEQIVIWNRHNAQKYVETLEEPSQKTSTGSPETL